MNNKFIANSIVGLALATNVAASNAYAVELDDFYLGASAVQTFIDERGLDEDTTGGKVFGGYKINQYFSVEASYYDFDTLEDRNNSLELDGFGLGVVASYPLTSNFSAFAKVGAHDWDVKAGGQFVNALSQDSDTDVFFGIGAKYKLTDALSLHAEAERFEVEDVDLDVASVGFTFDF